MATSAECSEQGAFGKDFGKSCVTSDLLQQCASGLIRNAAFDSQSALADGGIDGGQGGFLTRDPRAVERKKYGRPKARRSFQFSKR